MVDLVVQSSKCGHLEFAQERSYLMEFAREHSCSRKPQKYFAKEPTALALHKQLCWHASEKTVDLARSRIVLLQAGVLQRYSICHSWSSITAIRQTMDSFLPEHRYFLSTRKVK